MIVWLWVIIAVLIIFIISDQIRLYQLKKDSNTIMELFKILERRIDENKKRLSSDTDEQSSRIDDLHKRTNLLEKMSKIRIPTVDENGTQLYTSIVAFWALLVSMGLNIENVQSHIKIDSSKEKCKGD